MMRLRWASAIVVLCVLASASTAYAECAWGACASVVDHPVRYSVGGVDLP
jgi:hypothetical protein